MGGRRYSRLLRANARAAPLYLFVGTGAAAALALQSRPDLLLTSSSAEKIMAGIDGVVRSSRALYTIALVLVDYKYSLRGFDLDSDRYRSKLAEVHLRSAKRILKLCETNKGFYVKAGQFASSMRQIPKQYSSVLSSLQDKAVPCHIKDIKEVLKENLQKDLPQIFLSFDEEPIAAASIAQVHHAILKDNQEVAVKIQYPGLEKRMKIDISTMDLLSKLVARIFPNYRLECVVSEFERAISSELDFVREAKNSERTAKNFRRNNIVKVPQIFWEFTTSQVLTMEFCNGHRIDDLDFFKQSGINPVKIAKALMDLFAEMIFVHGFLHGDPHPGNILVSPRGHRAFSLVILDHGIYRELDERFRLDYCWLWKALILLDTQKIHHLGENFGVGKYAKYFPVIFTERTMNSKSVLRGQMSIEEKRALKQDLKSLNMGDISSFMESLPPDFLAILRTDGLLRSIISKLGAPRRVRLLAYAKQAAHGLTTEPMRESGFIIKSAIFRVGSSISYLQLRTILEILDLLAKLEELRLTLVTEIKWMLLEFTNYFDGSFSFLKL